MSDEACKHGLGPRCIYCKYERDGAPPELYIGLDPLRRAEAAEALSRWHRKTPDVKVDSP